MAEADADDGPPTLDAGRGEYAALLGALVATVGAMAPWIQGPTGTRTGLDLFGPLTVAVAIAVFAAVLLGEWSTGGKLLVGVLGVSLIAPAALVYRDLTGVPSDSAGVGLLLTLGSGAVIALAGSVAVLLEPPREPDPGSE